MIGWLCVVAIVAYYIYQYYSKLKNLPPGPTPLPLIGNLHQIDLNDPGRTFEAWGKKYGGLFTAIMGMPLVTITDIDLMRDAMVKNGEALVGRPSVYTFNMFSRGGRGIITGNGTTWKVNRRAALHILRDFGFGRNIMVEKIMQQTHRLMNAMERNVGKSYCIYPDLELAVSSIITDVIMSHDFDGDERTYRWLIETIDENFVLAASPITCLLNAAPWLRHVPLFNHFNYTPLINNINKLYSYFDKVVDTHIAEHDDAREPSDFIDAYLNAMHKDTTGELNVDQLRTITIDLFAAGSETTVTTLKWALILMLHNPKVQEKCREEILSVVGHNCEVTMSDRNKMPYVCATVAEIQRRSNILPIALFRETTKEVNIGGYNIPAGTAVCPHVPAILRDPKIFVNPDDFRPERFLKEDGTLNADLLEIVQMIFSLGKRVCLGESLARMELFLMFVTLLQRYRFLPDGQVPELKVRMGATVVPYEFHMRVQPV